MTKLFLFLLKNGEFCLVIILHVEWMLDTIQIQVQIQPLGN